MTDFPYLARDVDRHGTRRVFVRRYGKKVRIRAMEGTPAFAVAYAKALDRLSTGPKAPHAGTFGWLADQYLSSKKFVALDATSQRVRRSIILDCLKEPIAPGSIRLMHGCPVDRLTTKAILVLRDRRADSAGAANNRLKYLSAMFGWAVEARLVERNPVRDVKPIAYSTDGFYSWTDEDVAKFEARHPVGTKPRLALALLLLLGVRRGDVVRLGPGHVHGGAIHMVPSKMLYKRKTVSVKPILPELAVIIAATVTGKVTFLETPQGKPFSPAGFGNWFKDRCREAGLPQCTAHGLRKAGAARAALRGASTNQLMALFDWTSPAQAEIYTRAASRTKLTADAIGFLGSVPPVPPPIKDQ